MSGSDYVYGCLIKKRYNVLADWMIEDENGLGSDVITESIGQYSGVDDRDGVQIFEGDFCEDAVGDVGLVFFSEGSFWLGYNNEPAKAHLDSSFKVVGNNKDVWIRSVERPHIIKDSYDVYLYDDNGKLIETKK